MIFFWIQLCCVKCLQIHKIPATKTPPRSVVASSSVYDPVENRIITIGGIDAITNDQRPNIFTYNFSSGEFNKIYKLSEYEPNAYAGHSMFLRDDRKILVFGFFSGISSFNLINFAWTQERMTGDYLLDVGSFAFTSFIFKDKQYVAIFGGYSETGVLNSLYLIEVETLFSRKMPNNGNAPSPRTFPSMIFYKNALYVYGYIAFVEDNEDYVFKYDLVEESWEILNTFGDVPEPRSHHISYVHNDQMLVLYGYYLEENHFYNELYLFNLITYSWVKVSNFTGYPVIGASRVKVGNKIYLLFGRFFDEPTNFIQFLDLDEEILTPTLLTKNFISPSNRMNHCSMVINQYMYMYGGFIDNNEDIKIIYNDLWRFNLDLLFWESIVTRGESPSKRKSNSCCKLGGNRIVIFGGENEDIYLNDLYFLYEPFQTWYKVEPQGSKITARVDSCIVTHSNLIFIIGGKSKYKGFEDIWVFDLEINKYTKIGDDLFENGIRKSECWIEETSKSLINLIIVGGTDYDLAPNFMQFNISINPLELKILKVSSSNPKNQGCLIKENSAMVRFGRKSIVFGGLLFGLVSNYPLLIYDHHLLQCEFLEVVNDIRLYGHSAVHYKKSIFIFGGGGIIMSYLSYVQIFNNLYEVSFEEKDSLKATCSEGTIGLNCQPCQKGTYFSNGECTDCPKGTFNNKIGSTNIDQCIPCSFKTYSDIPGSEKCKDCFSSYSCPIGSIYPKENLIQIKNQTIQPSEYKDDKKFISKISNSIWYSFSCFFIVFLILSVMFKSFSSILSKFDMFIESHEHKLNIPVVYMKTGIGGVFSVAFLLASCITLVITLLNFYYDNVIEIRGTVPVIVIKDKISANNMQVVFTFYTYGGQCLVNNECNSRIESDIIGFTYSRMKMNCYSDYDNCIVTLTYSDAELVSKQAEILLKLKESLSFSSALSLNISTSSSIPDEISDVFTFIKAPSESTVFKGFNPTTFFIEFSPSVRIIQVFTSESSEWPSKETGYHVYSSQEPEAGSLATEENLNIQLNLAVKIVIQKGQNAMETQRLLRQGWFLMISALLGSVFGLMGTFATGMSWFEGLVNKYESKKEMKRNFKGVANRIMSLKSEFGAFKVKVRQNKIMPVNPIIETA